jgi:hypothetical protein
MRRRHFFLFLITWLALAAAAAAANPPLRTATGTVKKVTANVLFVNPRGPDGRFQDTLVLKLSGSTKVYTLAAQLRGGKPILVQKETDPRTLQPDQTIAVIYAVTQEDLLLLSAVVHPPAR